MAQHQECPQCRAIGADRSKDNLAVYPDGHSYCFACHYYKPASSLRSLSGDQLRSSLQSSSSSNSSPLQPLFPDPSTQSTITFKIPPKALKWLSKYDITNEEVRLHNFWYDLQKEILVFPIYDGDRLVSYQGRYFGTNPKYPKYLTKGYKKGHFKLFGQASTNIFILTEDYISALKVGRQFNAIPLLGSHCPRELILSLVVQRPLLRFWLDKDKADSSITQAKQASQWIEDCGTIITEKDPKAYSDLEIKQFIKETIDEKD